MMAEIYERRLKNQPTTNFEYVHPTHIFFFFTTTKDDFIRVRFVILTQVHFKKVDRTCILKYESSEQRIYLSF